MTRGVDLERLATTLRRRYGRSDPPLRLSLTNGGRQLTVVPENADRRDVLPDLKASRRAAPPAGTFELYIALQSPAEAAADARIVPPPVDADSLEVEPGQKSQIWTLAASGGDRIVVRLRRGERMTDEAARELMRTVREALA